MIDEPFTIFDQTNVGLQKNYLETYRAEMTTDLEERFRQMEKMVQVTQTD